MAEKIRSEKDKWGLGKIFLLLVLGIFIIWVLTGGPSGSKSVIKTQTTEKTTWPPSNQIPSYGATTTDSVPVWPETNQVPSYR